MENAAVKSARPLSLEGGGEQGKVDGREVGGPGARGRGRPLWGPGSLEEVFQG